MRYGPEQQSTTRAAIVAAAATLFKERGFAAVGIDAIAEAAGLTSGAVYSQFGSKETVFAAVLEAQLSDLVSTWTKLKGSREDWLQAIAAGYLSLPHCHNIAGGCPVATLSRDAARFKATRRSYEARLKATVNAVKEAAGAADLQGIWALYALLVGGITIARGMDTDDAAQEVLVACRTQAQDIARGLEGTKGKGGRRRSRRSAR